MASRLVSALSLLGFIALTTGCMEQYDPRRFWKQAQDEREIAHRRIPKLTAKGEIPPKEVSAAEADPIFAKYSQMCASCHGEKGMGDGAGAAGLNPKPRNFHDKAWQAKVDDAHIYEVIEKGGTARGLSGTMPPWGSVLSKEEIEGIVKMIRGYAKN